MKCVLQRKPSSADWMVGSLFIEGHFFCFTLEDELRETKLQAETAIPSGLYEVVLEDSPKFGAATITLKDVKGFSHIRVHGGNDDDQTEGCILVGDQIDADLGKISGAQARGVLQLLKERLMVAFDAGDRVWLEVRNAPGATYVDSGKAAVA